MLVLSLFFPINFIIIGKDEYALSEVATFSCVYIANSSISRLAVVDILNQNNDYAIIDAETSYGPKVYDKIVSDAGIIENEQQIN